MEKEWERPRSKVEKIRFAHKHNTNKNRKTKNNHKTKKKKTGGRGNKKQPVQQTPHEPIQKNTINTAPSPKTRPHTPKPPKKIQKTTPKKEKTHINKH